MTQHIIWASEAEDRHRAAPPAEKQLTGWVEETPPHEWFNWYMHRNDTRLNELENAVRYSSWLSPAYSREETIKAGERVDTPIPYIVGTHHLHVYIEGLLCEPGEENQYVECGNEFSESTYFRFNDDMPPDMEIRLEVPLRVSEPMHYADDTTIGQVNALLERVGKLEEPQVSIRLDSPAHTRPLKILAGEIFHLEREYLVGADSLQVFRNGLLLSLDRDYFEVGKLGSRSNDIKFAEDLPVSDSVRVYIAQGRNEEYLVLGSSTRIKELEDRINAMTSSNRVDVILKDRIDALENYDVPEYRPGSNTLKIYKNGALLVLGRDYSEKTGEDGWSRRIVWTTSIEAGAILTIITPARI